MNPLGLPAILIAFVIVQLACAALLAFAHWQNRERPPVTSKLLRPPGEHQRVKLLQLDERTSWVLLATSTLPLLILLLGAVSIASQGPSDKNLAAPALSTVGFILAAAVGGYFLREALVERHTRRRALDGHRIVSDCLAPLVLSGFKIFHDLPTEPGDPDRNLHHVVIGPSGIFAIESNTPANRPAILGRKPQEIVYDGEQLIYPWGQDALGLVPTRRKAEWLSEWIYQLAGERLPISAVLTFPGWWVTSTAVRDIRVFNPNQLAAVILQSPETAVSEHTRTLLVRHLEIHCRDVEA